MRENDVNITMENNEKIVLVRNLLFKGRRNIAWHEVEKYLRSFVGKSYLISEYGNMIFIGADFPDEFAGSDYTKKLKGTLAKAKGHSHDGKRYLYDIVNIKKETSKPFEL